MMNLLCCRRRVKLGSQYDNRLPFHSFFIIPFGCLMFELFTNYRSLVPFPIYTLLTWLVRSREFPLIRPYVDIGIESKSILPFRSFRIISSYGVCSQMDELMVAYETKRNGSLSSYCEPSLMQMICDWPREWCSLAVKYMFSFPI